MPILGLVIHDGALFEAAVAEIERHGTEGTLRFSPEGFSLTAEVDGKMISGMRILAAGGGCERFSCSESRSARLNLKLFQGLNAACRCKGKSALSIEIDPTGADSVEEASSPATLHVFWFNPPNPADQETNVCKELGPQTTNQQFEVADFKISLRLSKAENGTPLLEYDESMYEAVAGLSPAGIIRLDRKLKDLVKQDGRTEESQIRVMILLTPAMLGFFTSRTGWFHGEMEGDDSVEVLRKDEAVEDMRFGVYRVGLLRQHILSANTVNAARLCMHIQDGLPILLSCPIIDGDLGTLYFCCADPPPYHTQLFAFDFVKNFL